MEDLSTGHQADALCAETLEAVLRLLSQDAERQALAGLLDQVRAMPSAAARARLVGSLEMGIALKERFEQHQLRERGLLALIETAQDLTAITDLDQVLQAIVQRARKLVGCDVGYLSIYDEQRGDFYVRATAGAFSEKFRQIRIGREVGICGFVARNRTPYASSDYGLDERFLHTGSVDSAVLDENIKSILGVPLLAGGQVIGVLFVGDRYVRSYIAWEMSILSTLAAHASVAIGNARLFEQAELALQQASAANALLTRQTHDTRAAAEAHEQLTTLVARGGELRDICLMVSDRLGGYVAVCDETERTICHSGGGAQAFPLLADRSAATVDWLDDTLHVTLDESRRQGRSVVAFSLPSHVCRVCAVVGGNGLLGGLIIHTRTELNDVAVRIVERSATVTGVVLLLKERRESSMLSDIPIVVRGLVHRPQGMLAKLALQASALGLDLAQPVYLTQLRHRDLGAGHLVKQLRLRLKAPGVLIDEVGESLLVLSSQDPAAGLQSTLLRFFSEFNGHFWGVVSEPVGDPASLPEAFQAGTRCLDLMAALGRDRAMLHVRDLLLYSPLLAGAPGPHLDGFLRTSLEGLFDPRDARRVELARTLLAYLDNSYNARLAASAMAIHINTFRQRLESIDAMLGPWRKAGRALDIHMALRLWCLRDGWTPDAGSG
ncbi:GAF domain-containing protein [Pusillimonas sp. SM2304]|uniref:helix-turn-helix domain-containing protein n=1 Tax=Pusillimonas sp. SM2304 TaxID=3073241 RepID=UPI002875AE0A|nr:GAF domain-containing protein [Pusillimonas sp. SM2304]MDS1141788.1 GAF domain-containing protein [Pusillimonas sp. SM2304]